MTEQRLIEAAIELAELNDEIKAETARLIRAGDCERLQEVRDAAGGSYDYDPRIRECFAAGDITAIVWARGRRLEPEDEELPDEAGFCSHCTSRLAIVEARHKLRQRRGGAMSRVTKAARRLAAQRHEGAA